MESLIKFLDEIIESGKLIEGVISKKRRKSDELNKLKVKPIKIKGELLYQIELFYDKKVQHINATKNEIAGMLYGYIEQYFLQAVFYCKDADYQILISKKNKVKILNQKPTRKSDINFSHNRDKNYIIKNNEPCDFLIELGVMDTNGKVKPSRYDKFRQLNRYLELIQSGIKNIMQSGLGVDGNKPIRIIDFGCGKAYLTFALYYYLVKLLNLNVEIIGLDLKEDVIEFCNGVSRKLGYDNLKFEVGSIQEYSLDFKANMVISLHACDVATDAAIGKAVSWDSDVIFAVPCCQHELFNQMDNNNIPILETHGILKERFAALMTDAVRGSALEIMGYSTDIFEFIDMEHTPKNIMIRAIKRGTYSIDEIKRYNKIISDYKICPCIQKELGDIFQERISIKS